jgi:hypothetical protein
MTHTHTRIRQGLLLAIVAAALAVATASNAASIVSSSPSQPAYVRSGPEQSMPSGPSQLGREGSARWQRFHEQHPGVSFRRWWNVDRLAGLSIGRRCELMCPLRSAAR